MAMGGPGGYIPGPGGKLGKACPAGPLYVSSTSARWRGCCSPWRWSWRPHARRSTWRWAWWYAVALGHPVFDDSITGYSAAGHNNTAERDTPIASQAQHLIPLAGVAAEASGSSSARSHQRVSSPSSVGPAHAWAARWGVVGRTVRSECRIVELKRAAKKFCSLVRDVC